ncbi:cytochrome P450 4c3-like [Ischnura elegans]|uniref:cytochrome P450 4c3-like n=1 Tax=Ischnura elegans TaxID=197161 RepID=UPI001ED8B2BF|nr:cytochrome P450 4c3-like [Ischnura elegans]
MDSILKGLGGVTNAILAGAVVAVLLFLFWDSFQRWLRLNLVLWKVPGPSAYPIIGNALMFIGGPRDFFRVVRQCRNKYGTIFRLWVGRRGIIFVCGAETVQPLLSSSVHINKSLEYKCLEPWLGTGLINSGGTKWHSRRKLLTGAFHTAILEGYLESMDKGARKLAAVLLSHAPKDNPDDWTEQINVCQLTKLSALDVICETIMGYHINALEGKANLDYIMAIDKVNQILQRRFITPWLLSDFIFYLTPMAKEFNKGVETIHKFTDRVIKEKREEFAARQKEGMQNGLTDHPKRKSFLDLLLDLSDNGKVLSDADIREEVDTFMFAGHDTTSAAMDFSLYSLGHHPEAQEKILEETQATLEENGKLTLSLINKMEYLDRFIKEVLRLYPSVPQVARELDSPLTIDGHTFPPGTTINILNSVLHRDPRYFPNPDNFDPDRFLPSEIANRHSFAYTPFSAGSRNCIGQKLALMELKLVVIRIVQALEVRSIIKEEDLVLQGEITLNSPDGVPLLFRKRR